MREKSNQTNEEGRYYINVATLSAEAEDIFTGNITAKNINITKDNGKWGAESWSATANLTLPGLPIKNSAEAAIEYQRNKDQEIYTVSNAEVDIDIAGVSLGGAAAMQYVKNTVDKTNYWDYIVGDLSANGPINVGTLKFNANGGLGFAYGETVPVDGKKKSIYGISGSLGFDGLGGPLQYLSINAGNQLRDSNSGNFNYEEAINQIRTLKQPEKFDQLTINKLPENAWHFGNISAQTSNLDLGLVKVGSLGAGV